MAELALIIYVVYLALAFGLRSFLQWRATGSTGFVGLGGKPGSAEWLAGVLFAAALVLGVTAPGLDLSGVVEPVEAVDGGTVNLIGLALSIAGIALTLSAQIAMGASWRIGVNHEERTALVTSGLFGLVRNPIFAAMIPTAVGLALMVPSLVSMAAVAALFVALELQVRVVEEPYLLRVQGAPYEEYAAGVGRFVPGIGRLDGDHALNEAREDHAD